LEQLMVNSQSGKRIQIIPATKNAGTENALKRSDGILRAAAYCRVSTDKEEQLNSYEAQKAYYTQRIAENPNWELAGIFADEGLSGTSLKKRKEFNRMIAACKRGRIDLILTKSVSRFARNTVDCLETVRMLKANGIGVIFEKENINTLTQSSEFMITLFSGFAQAESESLSKNVAWGKQKSMEAGNVVFQFTRLLGYRRGADDKPEIVPEEAETVRRIYRRYLEGASTHIIKAELEQDNVPTALGIQRWDAGVIKSILKNEKYCGDALLQKTYVTDCISKKVKKNNGERPMYYIQDNHPAIVPREIYRRVQEEMARRSGKRRVAQKYVKTEQSKYSGKYALTELLVCGECGTQYRRVTWSRGGKKRIVWRCISRLEYGTQFCHNSPTIQEEKLHSAIVTALNKYAANQEELCGSAYDLIKLAQGDEVEDKAVSILSLKHKLENINRKQAKLLDIVLEDMENEALVAELKKVKEEKQQLQEWIKTLENEGVYNANKQSRMKEVKEWLDEQEVGFREYDDVITRKMIERIEVVDSETIRVKFRDVEVVIEQTLV